MLLPFRYCSQLESPFNASWRLVGSMFLGSRSCSFLLHFHVSMEHIFQTSNLPAPWSWTSQPPELDSGRFVGTNSFLAAALWSEFSGVTDLTHRGPQPTARLLQGSGCCPADFGGKSRGPSVLPHRLSEVGTHPRLRQGAAPVGGSGLGPRATDQQGAAAGPTRPHLPLPGSRAPPRPPRVL